MKKNFQNFSKYIFSKNSSFTNSNFKFQNSDMLLIILGNNDNSSTIKIF